MDCWEQSCKKIVKQDADEGFENIIFDKGSERALKKGLEQGFVHALHIALFIFMSLICVSFLFFNC